ncbi:hypothetical protein Tco_0403455 [Tanacetum coccineum]
MLWGYKVNTDGLKVCPDKADAVLSLPSPRCLKDVQKLNGKLASLNRFLSKSAEKSLPFFKTLKKCTKKSDFQWTQEAEAAFKQNKESYRELPIANRPKKRQESNNSILAAPRRAIRCSLNGQKGRKQNQCTFMSKLEIPWEDVKWKFELEGYDIQYRPRASIKGQILANFFVERPEEESSDVPMTEPEEIQEPWTLFIDGSSCIDGFGAGLILTNPEGGIAAGTVCFESLEIQILVQRLTQRTQVQMLMDIECL